MNIAVSRERYKLQKVRRKSDDKICKEQDKCREKISKERKIKLANISSLNNCENYIQKNMMQPSQ